jgi:hypothetical protein
MICLRLGIKLFEDNYFSSHPQGLKIYTNLNLSIFLGEKQTEFPSE